jgi:hypothetical protein
MLPWALKFRVLSARLNEYFSLPPGAGSTPDKQVAGAG